MNEAAHSTARPVATSHKKHSDKGDGLTSHDPNVEWIKQTVFANDPEYQTYGHGTATNFRATNTVDYLFTGQKDGLSVKDMFEKLRWGGQVVYVSDKATQVQQISQQLTGYGFMIDIPPAAATHPLVIMGIKLPFFGKKVHYLAARKVLMNPPGEYTDRFTYDVRLEPGEADGQKYIVAKRVPSIEKLTERLSQKFPNEDVKVLSNRARKMAETIFPVFLTREVAFLKILEQYLPEEDRNRVPRVVSMEKDSRGMVQKMTLNWLRKAQTSISQLEFAIQSTRMLKQLHEVARIIHLDLRLDNFVISKFGVGFVDYGSAVRVDEKIHDSPLLTNLFTEIMRTSQIQKMLEKMSEDGSVTSQVLTQSRRQADPGVDLFYLAVQIDKPHTNPYMAELVRYEPNSEEAKMISQLVQQVLRPEDAHNPPYRTASDVLAGLEAIREKLGQYE